MVAAGSQLLPALDPAPVQRWGPKGRTRHQGRKGENGDGNRDGGGDGNEDEDKKGHEDRDEGRNGSRNGGKNREDGGANREPENLRSGNRGRSEDATEGGAPTSNQQPQPQDPMPR